MENSNEIKRDAGKFKRMLQWKAEEVGQLMRSSPCIVQLVGHHRCGPCSAWGVSHWPNWEWFLTCWGCVHVRGHHLIFSFTQILHLPPTICGAKANVMEKARNNLDPESPQKWSSISASEGFRGHFPITGRSLGGKKSAFNKMGRLSLSHGTGPRAPSSKAWWSPLLGEPKPFNINDCQGFVLGTDMPATTETAPGSCKVYKKITLKTVQIGII